MYLMYKLVSMYPDRVLASQDTILYLLMFPASLYSFPTGTAPAARATSIQPSSYTVASASCARMIASKRWLW